MANLGVHDIHRCIHLMRVVSLTQKPMLGIGFN